jgi:mannose-6-phosphate isomerase-like protein (cupin superfamily)
MDTHRSDHPTPLRTDGISRREVLLGVGAGGLAAALLAHTSRVAIAQEATPSPAGGLPPGVDLVPLISAAPLDELPPTPAELHVTRLTIAPGVYFPPAPTPGPETVLVESGVLTCQCGAEGHPCSVLRANGAREEQPIGQDFDLNPGDVLLQPANVPDSAANNGTEPLVLLVVDIFPSMGVGTPTP